VSFRRRPFADAVERQLDLFADENEELLRRCEQAERDYAAAETEEAEARYSEYVDLVEIAADELGELRDAFASALPEETGEEYERAFDRAARKRFTMLRALG
jgi:hypothetical protein